MTQTDQQQNKPEKPIVTFQTANELLNKITVTPAPKLNLFDNPLEMQLSHSEQLITEGYCVHCINTKTSLEKCRKITNKLNLFAHFCNVCSALFGVGTDFLAGMKSLDNFELLSLDDNELDLIRRKDRVIYDKVILFKDHMRS